MGDYEEIEDGKLGGITNNTIIRNETEGNKWPKQLHLRRFREEGDNQINRPTTMGDNNTINIKNDRHLFADNAMLKTHNIYIGNI